MVLISSHRAEQTKRLNTKIVYNGICIRLDSVNIFFSTSHNIGKITNNIRLFKEKGKKKSRGQKNISQNAVGTLLRHVLGNRGLERGIEGREARREWRLTGIQTVADSVLAGAKKSATEGKTAPFKIRFTRGRKTGMPQKKNLHRHRKKTRMAD
ncbi:MAG: hypothetical protein IKR18_11775 [Bacteroidaceae bacterium]|nr:hypothetical protein [Bacteroidaceae bacterium]